MNEERQVQPGTSGRAAPADVDAGGGGYRIDRVLDGEGAQPPVEVLPDVRPEEWAPYRDLLDVEGRLRIAVGGFLLRGHGRTVLVDLGYGPGSLGRIPCGRMPESLRALGVGPADVTDVVFTHLHRDHVGWASVDGVPQFPRATLRCAEADYAHFVVERRDLEVERRLRPCADRFETFDAAVPVPGIVTLHAPGHTPGSTVVVVPTAQHRAVLLGDVAHCPVQLLEHGWTTPFDVDPLLARQTRARLLGELAGDPDARLVGAHFPSMRFGRLLEADGVRRWVV